MSKINLRKQTAASVSNPGVGQLSLFFDNSGFFSSKDEAGAIITYGTLSGLNAEISAEIDTKKGIANGIASLGPDSKIPSAQLPAIAITDTYVVASQAAMLALPAQTGEIAVRTDLSQTFILSAMDPTILSNWVMLMTPTDAVTSVNGLTGNVVITKAILSLGNVDNTSDVNKPVSTAQVAADSAVQAFSIQRANHTGTQLAATISNFNAAASAAAPVQSVAGKTGVVTLVKADVSLGNVVNLDTSTTANITDSTNKRFVTDAQQTKIAIVGNYSNVNLATVVNMPLNSTPAIIPGMTLSPAAGTHKVTFNGQFSATATSLTSQVATDLTATLNSINALTATGTHALVFGPETITPGVYDIVGAGSITTAITVTLDGQGNANSLFVFRMAAAFGTGASCTVALINGAQASNVFWSAVGAITLGASTTIVGTLLSQAAVSTAGGCVITGRLASTAATVGITTSTISRPTTASQITLGSFSTFAMFTNAGQLTAAGACTVNGDIGTNSGTITGFETSTVNGGQYTSGSISSILTFSMYSNGLLVPNSSRTLISGTSVIGNVATLDAVVTTTAGQSLDIRLKVDSGVLTTGNRNFTTVQIG